MTSAYGSQTGSVHRIVSPCKSDNPAHSLSTLYTLNAQVNNYQVTFPYLRYNNGVTEDGLEVDIHNLSTVNFKVPIQFIIF